MKVKDLVRQLMKMDQDLDVVIEITSDDFVEDYDIPWGYFHGVRASEGDKEGQVIIEAWSFKERNNRPC